jgi:hypothetical protein
VSDVGIGETMARGIRVAARNCSEISRSELPRRVAWRLFRRAASPAYLYCSSVPTKAWFRSFAATAAVSRPMNGSKSSSPTRVETSKARRTSRRGC